MNLGDRLVGLVLESDADIPVKGSAVGKYVDCRIDRGDFGLEEVFVLFELSFVIGLEPSPRLGVQVLVQDVGIIEIPGAGASGDEGEKYGKRREPGRAL